MIDFELFVNSLGKSLEELIVRYAQICIPPTFSMLLSKIGNMNHYQLFHEFQ